MQGRPLPVISGVIARISRVINPFAYFRPLIDIITPFVTGMGPPCGQLEHKDPNKVTSGPLALCVINREWGQISPATEFFSGKPIGWDSKWELYRLKESKNPPTKKSPKKKDSVYFFVNWKEVGLFTHLEFNSKSLWKSQGDPKRKGLSFQLSSSWWLQHVF